MHCCGDCGTPYIGIIDVVCAFAYGDAGECCIKIIEIFKKDVNTKIGYYSTPLRHLAEGFASNPLDKFRRERILEAMRKLIEYGADPHLRSSFNIGTACDYDYNYSAYEYAEEEDIVEIINLFDGCYLDIKEPDC